MEEHGDKSYRHILKYTSVFGGVQGIVILISLVRNKATALLLGVAGMGFASLMNTMQNFAVQCTSLGISFGAVPRLSEYYEQNDQRRLDYYIMVIRLWSLIAAMLGLLFCLVISPIANRWSFTWGNHTLHYAMLGFSVAMLAITGGEMAILKATRRLGLLARIQVMMATASLFICIPLYYYWQHTGVVPAILLMAFTNMTIMLSQSYRCFPLRLSFRKSLFADGASMIKLGVAFVLATAVGSGAEMLIRSYLNVEGSMDDVGLYNAAYMIAVTYAGMVFTAMEADYFPRLSAVSKDINATNETVNKQMEVSLLMLSPMLVALLMLLPLLIPMLFTDEFQPVTDIAQVAVLAMYFKVLTLPVAYITLARRYSLSFLILETAYFAVFVVMIAVGFTRWGIYGTGIAIVVAHIFDYFLINGYAYWKYGYRCTWTIARYATTQIGIGLFAFSVSVLTEGWLYWATEAVLVMASTAYSLTILRQKTRLWESLKNKILRTKP